MLNSSELMLNTLNSSKLMGPSSLTESCRRLEVRKLGPEYPAMNVRIDRPRSPPGCSSPRTLHWWQRGLPMLQVPPASSVYHLRSTLNSTLTWQNGEE
ncbi:hypothetical protein ACLKA7_007567 [Drosophila subpalustris]